ncbi:MAG: bifunctional hydroxymethylpyrimidine kinase/phosphomethylpyrimidine kinase [Halobacteriales archaeon]
MSRRPAPDDRPVAMTIAGSDSGGGAGIQADLKTMAAHGVYGTSVITSVTAQNTTGVDSTHLLPIEELAAQLDALLADFAITAGKTGMLATAPVIRTVADRAAEFDFPLVVDPVMVAASGDRLLETEAESAYEDLIPQATLVTPNADEAAVLTDIDPVDPSSARQAGEAIVELGADAALVKGGHIPGETVIDVLVTDADSTVFEHPRIDTEATHGSGCTLSSAIAAQLAQGMSLEAAVEAGVSFMERAVRYHLDVGTGPGSVHHLSDLRNRAAMNPTAEAVADAVRTLVETDVSTLVPEVGMNVVGATPYAEDPEETAAIEGRITRTLDGIQPNRGIRFGASSHVARFLLACREHDPALRFAINCRYDDRVDAALASLGWERGHYDRANEPPDVKKTEGSTMAWGAEQAFESVSKTPVAVTDPGDVGKEAITKLLARDVETLLDRVRTLDAAVAEE